jgi:hypothetical protein
MDPLEWPVSVGEVEGRHILTVVVLVVDDLLLLLLLLSLLLVVVVVVIVLRDVDLLVFFLTGELEGVQVSSSSSSSLEDEVEESSSFSSVQMIVFRTVSAVSSLQNEKETSKY